HQQMTKVCEGLIVQVARDASAFGFGFVGELEARVCELMVSVFECSARACEPAVFIVAEPERDERERKQHGERDGRAWEWRARDIELKRERRGRNQIF